MNKLTWRGMKKNMVAGLVAVLVLVGVILFYLSITGAPVLPAPFMNAEFNLSGAPSLGQTAEITVKVSLHETDNRENRNVAVVFGITEGIVWAENEIMVSVDNENKPLIRIEDNSIEENSITTLFDDLAQYNPSTYLAFAPRFC